MDTWELFEYAGEAMVALGVVGEVLAEWRETRNKAAKLSSVVLIAGLGLSLAALMGTNKGFNGRIAELNQQAKVAQARAAKDESDNLQLQIQLAREEQRTAEAEKEAALANARLSGWKLDDKARDRFIARVRGYPGTPFDVAVNPVEEPFMAQLDAILTSSEVGWKQLPPKTNGSLLAILVDGKASVILTSGISLEVDRDQVPSLKPAIIALGWALHTELHLGKIPIRMVPPGTWGDRIHIMIGKRE